MNGHELLTGRCALVTGAGSGIGRAIARAMAREGARVAATDLDLETAQFVAGEIGSQCAAFRLDVTSATEIESTFEKVEKTFGSLNIVVANAGVSTMRRVLDLTEEDWDFNMDVNAKGVFLTNREAVRCFLASGTPGCIVNTASLAGKTGVPLLAHYAASKFAVVGFTQSLAKEVARDGIRVNAVCPGFVFTSMQEREIVWEADLRGMTPQAVREEYVSLTPLGRIEQPEDVADTVVYLASDLARFVTGESVNVTGGVLTD